jgi:hypothetical protein
VKNESPHYAETRSKHPEDKPPKRIFQHVRSNTSHAARCVARHGVHSHAVPVALVGECSMLVV